MLTIMVINADIIDFFSFFGELNFVTRTVVPLHKIFDEFKQQFFRGGNFVGC